MRLDDPDYEWLLYITVDRLWPILLARATR